MPIQLAMLMPFVQVSEDKCVGKRKADRRKVKHDYNLDRKGDRRIAPRRNPHVVVVRKEQVFVEI